MSHENFIKLFEKEYEKFSSNHVKYQWKYRFFKLVKEGVEFYYIIDFEKDQDVQKTLT